MTSCKVLGRPVPKHARRPRLPHVHLVATGGTIAMRLDPDRGGAVPALGGQDLLEAVVIATRVPHGLVRPLYAYSGGQVSLREAGAILAGDLTPQKARVLLMVALANDVEGAELRRLFEEVAPIL
jgi:L-asparaginase/Glu-tRNA(Gln) amidotransferase subunit D